MNVPLANAAVVPGSAAQFAVIVPQGATPGQMLDVRSPDGQTLRVAVPAGCPPGSQINVAYQPLAAAGAPVAVAQAVAAPTQQAMGGAMGVPMQLQYLAGPTDPFAILSRLPGVSIKQQIQWAEVLVGWDMPEKYLISDPVGGHDLFVAAERSNGVMGAIGRQVFEGGHRPFTLDIAMLAGPGQAPVPFVRLERPFACTCCCLGRPKMHIHNVGGPTDCSLLCWGCPCGCQETNFQVYDHGQSVGNIKRQFNAQQALGMITGVNADSDQFHVDFKEVQSPEWKAALIAMALFLDYCYFVKGGKEARRESALGRAVQVERRWENDR
ncbi:Phospholipid scramblase 3 [Symbiodinium microadriaticum]|uniref:Phospholipid scramblase n=1 Tax=Symbiodinium microadriaticum TaxID=2951 RepID=A0A1Q9F2V7_SYMMI|nr:Phospholipid scramblase 3 [Symbiodinium microadriaticum]